jgi:Chemotaxis protein; stimulates methylation of MCP proteins
MSALPMHIPLEKRTHYLHAGRLHVSAEPTIITTILGSCVAVAIWDERIGAGGMNHFLLPHRIAGKDHAAARFGMLATHELIDRILALGATPARMHAKVFGGASMLGPETALLSIGDKNANIALDVLQERRIAVVASSIGGTRGRKVVFHTDSGETFVKVV